MDAAWEWFSGQELTDDTVFSAAGITNDAELIALYERATEVRSAPTDQRPVADPALGDLIHFRIPVTAKGVLLCAVYAKYGVGEWRREAGIQKLTSRGGESLHIPKFSKELPFVGVELKDGVTFVEAELKPGARLVAVWEPQG